MQNKERSAVSWLMEFAGEKRIFYIVSVVAAIIGVICSVTPFLFVSDIVIRLIERETRWSGYLMDGVAIAVLWMLRYLFHGISTCCSHKATFQVLANIRKRLCDKLAKVPLGKVKDTPSGALKNIIVERVDSIETTLAHVVPEFISNLLAPVVVFMYPSNIVRNTITIGKAEAVQTGYFVGKDCIGCKLCYSVCPQKCIDISSVPVTINQNHCLHCGRCAEICPKQCIEKRG